MSNFIFFQNVQDIVIPFDSLVLTLEKIYTEINYTVCNHLKEAITLCEDNDDPGATDLLYGLLWAREKTAWMLRSHFTQPPKL